MNQQNITGTEILAVAKDIAAAAIVKVTQVDQVIEFNQKVLKIEQRPVNMLNRSEFDISVKCLNEEILEFIEAHGKGDMIGCIDAMIDLRYFATGILYKMGLNAAAIKRVNALSSLSDRVVNPLPIDMLCSDAFDKSVKHLYDGVNEFAKAYADSNLQRCIDSIVDIGYDAIYTLKFMGLSDQVIADCDTVVHAANVLKKMGTNAKRATDGAADAVKPEGWTDPSIAISEILDREIARAQEV